MLSPGIFVVLGLAGACFGQEETSGPADALPADLAEAWAELETRCLDAGAAPDEVTRLDLPILTPEQRDQEARRIRLQLQRWGVSASAALGMERRFVLDRIAPATALSVRYPGSTDRWIVVAAPIGSDEAVIDPRDNWNACVLITEALADLAPRSLRHGLWVVFAAPRNSGQDSLRALLDHADFSLSDCDAAIGVESVGFGVPALNAGISARQLQFVAREQAPMSAEFRLFVDGGSEHWLAPLRAAQIPLLAFESSGVERGARWAATPKPEILDEHWRATREWLVATILDLDELDAGAPWSGVVEMLEARGVEDPTRPVSTARYRLFGADGPHRIVEPATGDDRDQ